MNRGIPISVKENQLQFKFGKSTFGIQRKDSKHFYYNIWIIYSSHGNGFYGILKQLPAYNGGKASQIIR